MKQRNRILSLMLAILLIVGMLPISTLTAVAAGDTPKHITLGTDAISGYNATNGYDYIYYGSYEGEPVMWRVLDDKTNNGEAGLFLLSEDLIGEGGEYGGIYFDTGETNIYQNSDAQVWCNGFYSTAFSQAEQREIIETTKSDSAYSSSSGAVQFSAVNNILNADKVFFLSAEEAENASYGFVDNSSRVAEYNRSAGYWWLRSPSSDYSDAVGYAKTDGSIFTTDADRDWAARPAFNLNTSKVLFTSAADGVTTYTNASEYLTSLGTYSGKKYKLTLLDESRSGFSVTEKNMQVVRHQTVRVHFTGAGTGTNDYVSLLIVDENDVVLYYGSIAKSTDAGSADFEVPSDIPNGNYTIKIFSEQKNGAYETDYASPFDEIALTVGEGHEHCVCGGTTNIGDHTAHPDIEFTPWNKTDAMPTTIGNYVLMNDVTVSSGWKPAEGETVLCLNGYDLVYDGENTASTVQLEENRTLTLCDCKGTGEITHAEGSYGRGVNVGGLNSLFIMYGGNICGNDAKNTGGGGGVSLSLNMIMYGGTISDNVSNFQGGGVEIGYIGSLTMYGGTIASNSTSGSGGGVNVSGNSESRGTFIMLGGSITGNAAEKGGGVMLSAEDDYYANITVGGNAVIKNNTADSKPSNLYLHYSEGRQEQQVVTIQDMTDGAEIGITMDPGKEGIFSTGGKDYKDKFFSDNAAYAVAVDGEDLELVEKTVQVGQVTLNNGEYTTNGINKTAGEPTGEGYAYFKDGVLTLNNFTYSGGSVHSNPAIGSDLAAIFSEHDLTIKVEGENSIERVVTDADTDKEKTLRGIWNDGDLEIVGDSRDDILKVTVSGHDGALANGVESIYESVIIENCTLEAKSITGGYALIGNKAITITRAKVVGSSGIANDSRSTFGIYTVTLKITNSDVAGIAENNSGGIADGIRVAGSNGKLIFESGSIIAKTSDVSDDSYAIRVNTNDVALPAKYWMRSSASGNFAEGTWDGANVASYFELTTTKPNGSITSISEMNKVYDGFAVSAPSVTTLSTGSKTFKYKVKGADDSTYTTEAPKNAGEYTCLITVAADENYTEATATKDFVISKATLTVTANNHQITYGEAPANDGVAYSGFVNNENENVLRGALDYDYSYTQFDDVGNTYTITPKYLEADNYDISYANGTLTVTEKEIGIDWTAPTNLVYDGNAKVPTAVATGLVDNDSVNITVALTGGNDNVNVGSFTYTATDIDNENYKLPTNVTSDSYTITQADQATPTTATGVNTTYIDTADGKITGVDSTMEYRKDGEVNYTAVTGTEITGLAAGKYYVRYAAKANYNASSDMVITISLGGKRTPTVDTDPTASRVIVGGKLSDSILTGGEASVPGTFTWKDGTEVLDSKGTVQKTVVFTPDDTATYNTVEFDVDVTVVVCDTVSGEHEFTEQMNNTDEHWTVCAKCKTEETDSREAHKGGTATCTAKAECSICGEEYGKMLDHKYEWVIDKEPTATEEGSKHEECTVCKAKQNENTAIPKTETNSPQTGDNSNMALWVALLFISGIGFVATTAMSRKRKTN